MKSRNLFVNLRATVPTASAEDFITEGLCWVLTTSPGAADAFLNSVLTEAHAAFNISNQIWATQVNLLGAQDQRSRPDMICEAEQIVFVFEHKVDESVEPEQIALHRLLATERYSPKRIIVVLVTKDAGHEAAGADVFLTWRRVQAILRHVQPAMADDRLLAQFIGFLGHEGLGRIPGPCPTYWKGNIAEARTRHPAFPMGYLDLGRKFGDKIMMAAIEDLDSEDEESREDRQQLLGAFRSALSSEDPEAAIWRFCRQFFPSYIKFSNDRFGTALNIPEHKGRRFARGVIESINEGAALDFLQEDDATEPDK